MSSVKIPLTKGYFAIVDKEDAALVSAHKWCVQQYKDKSRSTKIYAKRSYRGTQVTMHRFLLNPPKGVSIDHINGNGLDNRRRNLRLTNKQGNAANRPKDRIKNATSIYKGVYRNKTLKKWIARIQVGGKGIHLGVFVEETEAARAYNAAALLYFGDFACLNQLP